MISRSVGAALLTAAVSLSTACSVASSPKPAPGSGPHAGDGVQIDTRGDGGSRSRPAPATTGTTTATNVPPQLAKLPWPAQGQAAVDVEGIGLIGVTGRQKPVPIASVTKVMTALVVLRDHPLGDGDQGPMITIDAAAASESADPDQSTVRVQAGQRFSERDMLEMMLIPSGNNIARQLARWDAGTEKAFVAKMNNAARDLGMADTTYTGASGFEDSTRSTAADQLKLAKKVAADTTITEIAAMPSATVAGLHARIVNTNTLLGQNGVTGTKTGSSTPAGGALMWAARQPDAHGTRHLVLGVVLDQHQGTTANDCLRAVLDVSRTLIAGVGSGLAGM